MVRISILYPNVLGATFDFAYYLDTHMPMAIALLSTHPGFAGVCVERGLGGALPGSAPAYLALCHFRFSSVDDFLAAFLPHAETLQGDMKNYTPIEPVIQFNEVLLSPEPALPRPEASG